MADPQKEEKNVGYGLEQTCGATGMDFDEEDLLKELDLEGGVHLHGAGKRNSFAGGADWDIVAFLRT